MSLPLLAQRRNKDVMGVNGDVDQDVTVFWSLLLDIIADAEKRLAAYMAVHRLTPPQFFVLRTLVSHGGRYPIGQIAREHHLTNATLTGLVKRLEALHPPLVTREPSATDRRSVYVLLTPAGEQLFNEIQTGLLEQVRVVFSLLSPEERHDVLEKIARYVTVFLQNFPIEQPE